MKKIFVLLASVLLILTGCHTPDVVQVEFTQAELVKIDTILRFQDKVQLLTWKDTDNNLYVTYAAINNSYELGTVMNVLRAR